MKINKTIIFAMLAISLFAGCGDKDKISDKSISMEQNNVQETESQEVNETEFNLVTNTGKKIVVVANNKTGWRFEGLEGKAILLDFFGTWCPPCKAEIPHLNNIRNKISDKFEIIGIDLGSRSGQPTNPDDLKAFIEKFEIKYPVTTAGDNNSLFQGVLELNKAGSIPFMLLFNAKGEFVTHYIGMVPEEMIQGDIDRILGK